MVPKLHYYQKELIRKLMITKGIRFNALLIEGLESEHMNYHLKKLVELELVTKSRDIYSLSDSGKDFSNALDDEMEIEKQPKISIIINGIKKNSNGEYKHLLCKRLRQPYYGKVGRLTGKVKFGETFTEAAKRELYEETGLSAESFLLDEIYHKMRKKPDGTWVQDVVFFKFLVVGFKGNFIAKTEFQENFWLTKEELGERKDLDLFDDLVLEDRLVNKPLYLKEMAGVAKDY